MSRVKQSGDCKNRNSHLEVITYEEDRLNYFTALMNKAQKRYKRLFKKYKDAPYLSAESQMLSDVGRESHFHHDVVEMLEKGYRVQSEWISVDERLPEPNEKCLIAAKWGDRVVIDLGELVPSFDIITKEESYDWLITYDWDEGEGFEITHWMPLPEAPKMKGGAE